MIFQIILFVLSIYGRYIVLKPSEVFVFYDNVKKGKVHKIMHSSKRGLNMQIFDPDGRLIFAENDNFGSIYTNIPKDGRIKIVLENRSAESCDFYYKCPDPEKELRGNLGYMEDVNYVAELERVLNSLIDGQKKLIERTTMHQQQVRKSRWWAHLLMVLEFCITAAMIYLIHDSFVKMFETRQKL